MKYEVKNIESFRGRQGIGYRCDLIKNGEKVGTVEDYANGGAPLFRMNRSEVDGLKNFAKEIGLSYANEEVVMSCLVDSVENHASIEKMVVEYNKFFSYRG